MTSSTICIDANIVVKFLVPSSSQHILELWDSWKNTHSRLVAPTLLQYEVSNALYQMTRHRLIDMTLATRALQTMVQLPIELINRSDIHGRSLAVASDYGIKATYDAHYLALSEQLGCVLWTADKRFFNTVRAECPWVHLVEGY